jgi:hypothetical protein
MSEHEPLTRRERSEARESPQDRPTLAMREKHPWLRIIVGRCGSGKTTIARKVLKSWRASAPEGPGERIFVIDPVATDPPGELHLAGESDLWQPEPPEEFPPDVTLIAVDEADLSLHQADARRKKPPPLHGLVRRRRHAGVSVLLLTQRPALIARDAWALADEIIVCSTTDSEDLKRLGKLPGVTQQDLDRVSSMGKAGIGFIWSPTGVRAR